MTRKGGRIVLRTAAAVAMLLACVGICAPAPSPAKDVKVPKGARPYKSDGKVVGWFAPQEHPGRPALPSEVTKAFVIPIHGGITETTYDAVKRKVIHCRTEGAEIVVFDMNTPGGSLGAIIDINRLILEDLGDVYTVAYVNPEAISAGAIMSLACNEIVMSPIGKIGDAMPVMVGPQGYVPIPEKERGKIESYARAEIRVLAAQNRYNVLLCEAMITQAMEIWLIRHSRTGEVRIADAAEARGKVSGVPLPTQPGPSVEPKAPTEWEYVVVIDDAKELLTMTPDEAIQLGFAEHVFANMGELEEHYNIVEKPVVLTDTWSEKLVGFLTSPIVSGLLFAVAILALYIELTTPGIGIPGTVALICFAVLFGSRYLVGLANWIEIALFFVGLALIAVEIFITPGFGVLGISGVLLCAFSLLAILVANTPKEFPWPKTTLDWATFSNGVAALTIGLIAAVIGAGIVSKFLPKIPIAGRLVLASAAPADGAPVSEASPVVRIRAGDRGVVESMCRPIGTVRFGEDIVDASSEGGAIEKGAKVRVLRYDGNRVVVEEV